jgi:cellulose synthase/poly-beta-1,6-N-acetylglucosamine synthase-like glycosyltransferase
VLLPLLLGLQAGLAVATAYLLGLLAAAADELRWNRRRAPLVSAAAARLVVLIPAHDEAAGIQATLTSILSCDYPRSKARIVVVADNCSDETAERAAEMGAEVWIRNDSDRRGKGYALSWAFSRLRRESAAFDGVVVIDADCLASTNLLAEVGRRLNDGASALQVDYKGANPGASEVAALRFGALALTNTVRGLGKERLGFSSGLVGSGMAFSATLVHKLPWQSTGLTEDDEYHMQIVLSGRRSEFLATASIQSPMPTSYSASLSQLARWEAGKAEVARRGMPHLLRSGWRRRDVNTLHAAFEIAHPPQSVIAAGSIVGLVAGIALQSRGLRRMAAWTIAGQAAFVLLGLRLVGAPRGVYRALLTSPRFLATKLNLYFRMATGKTPREWVRTERGTENDMSAARELA